MVGIVALPRMQKLKPSQKYLAILGSIFIPVAVGAWLFTSTRLPYLLRLGVLILSGTNETVGQELYRTGGPSVQLPYSDFLSIVRDPQKCHKELDSALMETIEGKEAWLLEFHDPQRGQKIVLIPAKENNGLHELESANVVVDHSENGEYRREMAKGMIIYLIQNPRVLFNLGASHKEGK